MKKYILCLFTMLVWWNLDGYCQSSVRKLEETIDLAYKKAYPACVKIFAYDTLANQQAGGQFSGVVVTHDGYILTAAHVASPGVVYKVMFPDGTSCIAKGLGKIMFAEDKTRPDAAMLKIISAGNWPYAILGNSDEIKTYEPCISLSYPETLYQPKPTLRFGYVSNPLNDRGFIKSTCLMEPGDSGGPLFDYRGRLIGIHSAIQVPEADNYDVPVNIYRRYWDALAKPRVYMALPPVRDKVQDDPSAQPAIAVPALKNDIFFNKMRTAYNNSCYLVRSISHGKKLEVAGTLFSINDTANKGRSQSVIVTKSSLVGEQPVIVGKKSGLIHAKIIARDKSNDLVLIVPDANINGGINYQQQTAKKLKIDAGMFLVSAQPDSAAIVSISGGALFSLPKRINAAFLGVGFKSKGPPLKIGIIFPNQHKSIYQLRVGDTITNIGRDTATDFVSFLHDMNKYWPGDTVKLMIKRAGNNIAENVVLDTIPQRHIDHPAEKFAGGKSERRDGFAHVFTHDAVIKPCQCGGPVFDINGDFCGLNIARYSRVSTLALPSETICDFISDCLKNI